jgi:DNA (cytosine-5)-methyltransferase 1
VTHVDLFSGIGGFSIGLESVGFETILFCEYDKARQRDLKHHWPGVPVVADVNDTDAICGVLADISIERCNGEQVLLRQRPQSDSEITGSGGRPFILTAGVPCQPASSAGKRKGSSDDRWLWPQTLRVVERLRPRWCVFENPLGIASLSEPAKIAGVDLERLRDVPGRTVCEILSGINALGYDIPTDRDGIPWVPVVPAAGVGAYHGRDRLFIIARRRDVGDTNDKGPQRHGGVCNQRDSGGQRVASQAGSALGDTAQQCEYGGGRARGWSAEHTNAGRELPDWTDARIEQGADGIWRAVKPGLHLLASGIPGRVAKLRGFGNTVIPQIVAQIGQAIIQSETYDHR